MSSKSGTILMSRIIKKRIGTRKGRPSREDIGYIRINTYKNTPRIYRMRELTVNLRGDSEAKDNGHVVELHDIILRFLQTKGYDIRTSDQQ